jgi:hypothetical protein
VEDMTKEYVMIKVLQKFAEIKSVGEGSKSNSLERMIGFPDESETMKGIMTMK